MFPMSLKFSMSGLIYTVGDHLAENKLIEPDLNTHRERCLLTCDDISRVKWLLSVLNDVFLVSNLMDHVVLVMTFKRQ